MNFRKSTSLTRLVRKVHLQHRRAMQPVDNSRVACHPSLAELLDFTSMLQVIELQTFRSRIQLEEARKRGFATIPPCSTSLLASVPTDTSVGEPVVAAADAPSLVWQQAAITTGARLPLNGGRQ